MFVDTAQTVPCGALGRNGKALESPFLLLIVILIFFVGLVSDQDQE
jgi:hypothetical protein